jgi:hypothetical protein
VLRGHEGLRWPWSKSKPLLLLLLVNCSASTFPINEMEGRGDPSSRLCFHHKLFSGLYSAPNQISPLSLVVAVAM